MHFVSRIDWIVFVLIKLGVVAVCIKAEMLSELPASFRLREDLAESVCDALIWDSAPATRNCIKNFLNLHYESDQLPPTALIKCQSEKTVTFAVPPSKEWQLIVILDKDKTWEPYLNFVLMEPAKELGELFTPEGNYTIWTALLSNDGRPSHWKEGLNIQPWHTLPAVENRTYIIWPRFLHDQYKNGSSDIDAEVTWNSTDPTDSCFQILNRCDSKALGNIFSKKVTPDMNRTVIIKDLPIDDACSVTVIGKYGRTDFTYHTPSCYDLPECEPLPDKIENITLELLEDRYDSWTVRVRWRRPDHLPAYYTVTLNADEVYSINVTGSTSEVTFVDVRGDGLYNVRVLAFTPGGTAGNTVRDIFPPHEEPASLSAAAAGAAALCACAAAGLAFGWWKRQRDIKKRNMYFPGLRDKLAKEEAEACSPESSSEDQWEVKPERLTLHEVIGEGAFGVVRRGTLAPENKDVAVKMLKDFPSAEEIRSFRAEMELMKSVGRHAHVVGLLGCCRARRPWLAAEYCSRGDLLTYLRCCWDLMVTKRNAKYYNNNKEYDYRDDLKCKRDSRLVINRLYDLQGVCDSELTMLDLLSFCRQIAMGMEFLASNRVVHRDLAARNILVTADKTLKIADFGLSRDIYQENQYKQKGNGKMPVKWMALESLTHRIYTTQSDVWSFGVVVWEVATLGGAPYPGVGAARLPRLLRAGYRMQRPHNCSPQLYELMLSCWHDRPRSRPTFGELHARLDELLCASARHYLEVRPEPRPDAPAQPRPRAAPDPQRYVRMLIRGKWPWSRRGYHQPSPANDYSLGADYKLTNSLQTD